MTCRPAIPAVLLAGLFGLLILAAPPSLAQEEGTAGRYTMERTPEGVVRLDTRTGEVVLCRGTGGQLVCGAGVAGPGTADLEAAIAALEERVRALEEGGGGPADAPPPRADLPSEEEFERTMSMMERFMRRFFSVVEDLNRDLGEERPEPGGTVPDPAPDTAPDAGAQPQKT